MRPASGSGSKDKCSTATASRCRTACWKSGRPTRQGRFADPKDNRALPNSKFRGFGRCGTGANGEYAFDTIKPGPVPDPDGKPQAPHILVAIFARGMILHNYTRIYFDGEAANAADPVLALVPADRRTTLIARREAGRQRRLPIRHPPSGRQRDGFFRRLRLRDYSITACSGPAACFLNAALVEPIMIASGIVPRMKNITS